jgi:hypothetical protein
VSGVNPFLIRIAASATAAALADINVRIESTHIAG